MSDQPDKLVTITMQNGVPTPDIDPVQVKKDSQKIKWCADFDFQIAITGYSDVKYSSGGNGCAYAAKSGYFTTITNYKYTISANGVDNDPGIEIKP